MHMEVTTVIVSILAGALTMATGNVERARVPKTGTPAIEAKQTQVETPPKEEPAEPEETSAPVENPEKLTKLAETAKFTDVPESFEAKSEDGKSLGTKTIAVGHQKASEAKPSAEAKAANLTIDATGDTCTCGDAVVVTAPQGLVRADGQTCLHVGDELLVETTSGRLVRAVVGDLLERQTDEATDIYETLRETAFGKAQSTAYGQIDGDMTEILSVWREKDEKTDLEKEGVKRIAVTKAFERADAAADEKTDTEPGEPPLGRWDAAQELAESEGWDYVKDVVIRDGSSAEAVSELGLLPGDVVANGTGCQAPARRYLGDDGQGNAQWERADMQGNVWDTTDWETDLRRHSVWRPKAPAANTAASTTAAASTATPWRASVAGDGVRAYIESCRKEAEDWASGANANQPWKYIDYWKSVIPNGANTDLGGQCSEYVLWNLMNIGLIPGKTMADLDKICWGARCEIKFLQDHPEYGEIHALDGQEDGCIPGYYVPRPGDICVMNHGDHFEMVSEVYEDHWEGYSSGSEGCGPTWHAIDPNPNADNHDGYYVFLTIYFDKALADSRVA